MEWPARTLDVPQARPVPEEGPSRLSDCVAWQTVVETPVVQAAHWHCLVDGEALQSERLRQNLSVSLAQSGACRLHLGSWSATLDPATAVLQQPGAPYRTSHPFGCGDHGWTVAFQDAAGQEILERSGARQLFRSRPTVMIPAQPLALVIRQLVLLHRGRNGHEVDTLAAEELGLELLETLVHSAVGPGSRAVRSETRAAHGRLAERTRDYLVESFHKPLKLSELAEAVCSSPAHLCRVFKRHTGKSIGEYARRLRLGAVVDDLLTRQRPLNQDVARRGRFLQPRAPDDGLPPRSGLPAAPGPDHAERTAGLLTRATRLPTVTPTS